MVFQHSVAHQPIPITFSEEDYSVVRGRGLDCVSSTDLYGRPWVVITRKRVSGYLSGMEGIDDREKELQAQHRMQRKGEESDAERSDTEGASGVQKINKREKGMVSRNKSEDCEEDSLGVGQNSDCFDSPSFEGELVQASFHESMVPLQPAQPVNDLEIDHRGCESKRLFCS